VPEERAALQATPVRRRRVPIRLQVLLAAGGLLSLLAFSMAVAIVLVIDLNNDRTHLDDRGMRYTNAVAAAALNAKAVANDQRGFLLTGDPKFLQEADQRTVAARVAFSDAAGAAADPGQRRAVSQASAGFERWVRALRAEVDRFKAGDRRSAITASMGADRALRKTYEQSLADAQSRGASSIRSTRTSVEAASSRSLRILLACSLSALAIGFGVSFWLVRSIAMPVSRLMALLRVDMPSRGSA
jgi:methyl-accepting chemotaxis protein